MQEKELKEPQKTTTSPAGNFFSGPQVNHFFPVANNIARQVNQPSAVPELPAKEFENTDFPNFDAKYVVVGPSPQTGTLFITHKVFFDFPTSMNKEQRDKFQTDFSTNIHDTWSEKHLLTLNDPVLMPYQCKVEVMINVVDKPKDAHTTITVKDELHRPAVNAAKKQPGSETTHTAVLKKTHASEEQLNNIDHFDFVRQVGDFDIGQTDLDHCPGCQAGISEVEKIIQSIPPMADPSETNVGLTYVGRASSDGNAQRNKELGEARAKAVAAKVKADIDPFAITVIHNPGAQNATQESKFRRVDVLINDRHTEETDLESQNQSVHEFGHMMGFGDEYVEETKDKELNNATRFRGDKPTHYNDVSTLVDKQAADELIVSNNTSVMSHGMDVKRGHYAYFVDAMNKMTLETWQVPQ